MAITKIQIRRDTAANWLSANPLLADGEHGYDKTAKKYKTGDGSTLWNALAYDDDGSGGTGGGTPADGSITFAKIQSLAVNKLIGRNPTTGGSPQEILVGQGLKITGTTIGTDFSDFSHRTAITALKDMPVDPTIDELIQIVNELLKRLGSGAL